VILLDTCAIVYDALAPEKLGRNAAAAIAGGRNEGRLACSDISLWEIAMLIEKGRILPDEEPLQFLHDVVAANHLTVFQITPEIAFLAAGGAVSMHGDPADRIIAATAKVRKATLLTCDRKLREVPGLKTVW
jgi:PIN domain nuclease of toxin-antitoxin system